MLKQAN